MGKTDEMLGLLDLFDRGLILLFQDGWKKHHPRKSHYVTELSFERMEGKRRVVMGKCLRMQYYDWKEVKPTDVDVTRLIYPMFGSVLHDHFFKAVWNRVGVEMQDDIVLEKKVEGLKYPVRGRMDYVFPVQKTIAEIKTTYGRGIQDFKKNGPKNDYLMQLSWYRDHAKQFKGYRSSFLYFARDNFYRTESVLGKTKYRWAEAYKRWEKLEWAVDKSKLPLRDFEAGIFPCTWCMWEKRCDLNK